MKHRSEAVLPPVDRLDDPDYWRDLLPGLHMTSDGRRPLDLSLGGPDSRPPSSTGPDPARLRRDVLQHGYHVGPSDAPFAKELAEAVQTLSRAGHDPLWVLLSDEAWMLAKWFQPLLEEAFPGLRILSDYYVFVVDPRDPDRSQGWAPHRDRVDMPFHEDGAPQYVTVWISLTNSAPENGCIYLVPSNEDPEYDSPTPRKDPKDYQSIRAVPVPAGTPIFWTGRTLHWGGRAAPHRSDDQPRLSVGFAAARPEYESTWIEVSGRDDLPTVAERIDLVFQQLQEYRHRLPANALYAELHQAYRER